MVDLDLSALDRLLALPAAARELAIADLGLPRAREASIRRALRARASEVAAAERELAAPLRLATGGDAATLCAVLRPLLGDRELPAGLTLPPGYVVDLGGVWLSSADDAPPRQVCARPLVLTGRLGSGESTAWILEFATSDGWSAVVAPAARCRSARDLVAIGDLPVASDNAAEVVRYLRLADAHLSGSRGRLATSLGWAGTSYVAGLRVVGPDGETRPTIRAADAQPAAWGPDPLIVAPPRGLDRLVGATSTAGTLDGWRAALADLPPRVAIGAVAALAAPLLGTPIGEGTPNGAIEWAAQSSTGKSASLRLAASVWGSPEDGRLLLRWDSTPAAIEEIAGFLRDLPLCLDETSVLAERDRPRAVQLVYSYVQGRGRDRRLSDRGVQAVAEWRGILLSTGEVPIGELCAETRGTTGQHVRLLTVHGPPWGAVDAATGRRVRALTDALRAHHGHAGAEWIAYLQRHREEWPKWARETRERVDRLSVALPGVAGRLAPILGLLEWTAAHAAEALGIPPVRVADVWPLAAVAEVDAAADAGLQGLLAVLDWLDAHPGQVSGRSSAQTPPAGGWVGIDLPGGDVALLPGALGQVWRDARVAPGVVRQWRDRGWIALDREGRHAQLSHPLIPRNARPIRILAAAIHAARGGPQTDDAPAAAHDWAAF